MLPGDAFYTGSLACMAASLVLQVEGEADVLYFEPGSDHGLAGKERGVTACPHKMKCVADVLL